ncbi:hypothetical protein JG687_00009236 [Phytophthora cactorum]|uniref:Uncharacterized protein n=1 Tax=Phytophthora cactorum TaxID=29920 RepID=A0A8T1UA87_9STRA|nr:hypothetical protein JG687_00009236 [Phytophthora cactorum]
MNSSITTTHEMINTSDTMLVIDVANANVIWIRADRLLVELVVFRAFSRALHDYPRCGLPWVARFWTDVVDWGRQRNYPGIEHILAGLLGAYTCWTMVQMRWSLKLTTALPLLRRVRPRANSSADLGSVARTLPTSDNVLNAQCF